MIGEGMRVLVFSAHAADFCSRAGGTIIRFVEAGGTVQVYDMTYGERCESATLWARDPRPTPHEIKAIRKAEIEAAAGILGAEIDCFDFGDSPLILGPDRRLQVLDTIRAFRPDLVLSHWINDFTHPDHFETTQAVLWARSYCGAPGIETSHPPFDRPDLVCYEAHLGTAPVTKFLPHLYVDITSVFDRKVEAMKALAAQPQLSESYGVLARYRALEANITAGMDDCRFAEGFARIGTQAVG
jgi:4-oxalomesaconate hydratase